jgi:hypothetical protein
MLLSRVELFRIPTFHIFDDLRGYANRHGESSYCHILQLGHGRKLALRIWLCVSYEIWFGYWLYWRYL